VADTIVSGGSSAGPIPPSTPENCVVKLELPALGLAIDTFTSYEYSSHFLTPSDGWSFTIGNEDLIQSVANLIKPGMLINMSINGHVQSSGYVDGIETHTSRSSGTEFTFHGRDRLAYAVDACADPRLRLMSSQSLQDVMQAIFAPFGFNDFVADNNANRNVVTGTKIGIKTSKKGKPLKSQVIHQLKPYSGEGCFAFAARVAQRLGLWIWLSADGQHVVVSTPDFAQQPSYKLAQKRGPADIYNNVLSSHASIDISDQPSCIIATGFGTGGENPVSNFSLGVRNPAINADIKTILSSYRNTLFIPWPADPDSPDPSIQTATWIPAPVTQAFARPLFLHDDEAHTILELKYFLRREMSLRVRKTLTYNVEVEGHGVSVSSSNVGSGDIIIWGVDTIVDVDDDYANVHEPLYVLGRTFTKSRDGGTKTRLDLIRPHSIEF